MGDKMEIAELQRLCEQTFIQREITDTAKAAFQEENKILEEIEARLLAALEENNLKSFKSEYGDVGAREKASVKIPQGENREVFFNYLREKGDFDALITVNSQTLNGWYKIEAEKAREAGQFFFVPGLEIPITSKTLYMKKGK